ncbi:MAG: ATP-binding protein [Planctomycetota bacterium]
MEGLDGKAVVSGESLDMARFNQPGYLDNLREWLKRKYQRFQPEVIVAFGEECLSFAARLRSEMWPEIPIVFAAIPPGRYSGLRLPANCTGVVHNDFRLAETLDIARRLLPRTRRVAFVAGQVAREPFNQSPYEEFQALPATWERIDLTGLPMDELKRRIAGLPSDTVIYYSAVFVDGDGRIWGGPQALREIAATASQPIFSNMETFIGEGAVGGRTMAIDRFALGVAKLTLRTMEAKGASGIPVEFHDVARPVFDDRLLRRFGIARSRLPDDADIRFRIPSLWDDYRRELVLATVVFGVQTATLSWLIVSLWRRHRTERALRRVNQYLELAAESANVNVWEWDIEQNLVVGKERLRGMLNVSDGQRLTIDHFTARVHPEDAGLWQETVVSPASGSRGFDLSCRFLFADGEVHWLDFRGHFEYQEPNGEPTRARGIVADVTRRTRAELELAARRENAAQFTRASTLGEMAASIAHELGQPLTAIRNFTEAAKMLLSEPTPQLEKARNAIIHIQDDGQRAADILVKIRGLFQRRRMEIEELPAKEFLLGIGLLMRTAADQYQTRLAFQVSPRLTVIRADRTCLQQAIANLVRNAFEASQGLPPTQRTVLIEAETDGHGGSRIQVHDHGPGISGADSERIFLPFFTTKPQGLGLGLPLVRSIAEAHGGRVWATRIPGGGTTFTLEIPASQL